MVRIILAAVSLVFFQFACASTKPVPQEIRQFHPIEVNVEQIQRGDFGEVIAAVNNTYADGADMYGAAEVYRQDTKYMYIRVFSSGKEDNCYRVTIDKVRSKIVNMQPDC